MARKESKIVNDDYMNNKKYPILPSRLAHTRTARGYTQKEFAELLTEASGAKKPIIDSVISMWETGRRPVSPKHNQAISSLLGVSIAYLVGLNNDPHKESIDTDLIVSSYKDQFNEREEIPSDLLYAYDGLPIYVEFSNYEHVSGWGIYSDADQAIIMINQIIPKSTLNASVHLFRYNVVSAKSINDVGRSLPLALVMTKDRVWIKMKSPDPVVRALYNGWYYPAPNGKCLINALGCVLPYDGLNITYTAHSPYGNNSEE